MVFMKRHLFVLCSMIINSPLASEESHFVRLQVLNKLSGKKTTYEIQTGSSIILKDIRIEPQSCHTSKDSFHGKTYQVPVKIYLEQDQTDDVNDPLELYSDTLSTNPRSHKSPFEHPIYDILLLDCD